MVCCHLPPFCANQDWCYTREAWWKWEWGKCLLAGPPPTVVQIAYWARLLLRGRVGAETQPELHLAKPCALPWGSILQEKGMPFLMHKKTVYISGSRIWYFHCSILGGCYGAGLIPGPGPFILHGCSQKKKKKTTIWMRSCLKILTYESKMGHPWVCSWQYCLMWWEVRGTGSPHYWGAERPHVGCSHDGELSSSQEQ